MLDVRDAVMRGQGMLPQERCRLSPSMQIISSSSLLHPFHSRSSRGDDDQEGPPDSDIIPEILLELHQPLHSPFLQPVVSAQICIQSNQVSDLFHVLDVTTLL